LGEDKWRALTERVITKMQYFNKPAFSAPRNSIISVLVVFILLGPNCLFIANSLAATPAAAASEPALYRLLTFQVPNLTYLSRCLCRTRISVDVRGLLYVCFVTRYVLYREEFLAHRQTLQAGGPPLVGCTPLLIQCIRSCPPYWRPFLQVKPEDAPCRGDREPLITD
jgi:hypothetical protein